MMSDEGLLAVRDLSHQYGRGQIVIARLNFEVKRGEFLSIVGPSGCGKTTLLRSVAGLQKYTGGEIRFERKVVRDVPKGLAMVFQDYSRSLMPWSTIWANVELPLKYKVGLTAADRRRMVTESLRAVGLGHVGDKYPWQLSGGMQQRIAIARALAYQPRLLLMDEPFASVDAQMRADLEDLVARVRYEFDITVLLVTHDIDEAVYLADRIIVLSISPSSILAEIKVTLPKERNQIATRASADFVAIRTTVSELIYRSRGTAAVQPNVEN
jgi:NitT/TauT family transport system ATP-binding protein